MKSKQQRITGMADARGGVIRWASWLAAMALSAALAIPLGAEVIDDFHECPGWDGLNNPSGAATFECVEEQLRMAADFTTATDPANPFNTFGNIYYLRNLPVRQKQTLELRVDLVSANRDDVFAFLGTMTAAGGEYFLLKDANEIGLLKWSATEGCSVAFWESRTIMNQGVVLVLSLTPIGESLVIRTEVKRKSDQLVLYERVVVDGPGSDWPVPDPLPQGWQILTPDAGPPYAEDLTVVWLAMHHQTDGLQGPAELRLDNFEYALSPSPYLDIDGGATLLTWPDNTAEEQIVVTADSLSSSVWTPWPEPIFERFGQCCMAVPATSPKRFAKLVPGTQFIDDFDPPTAPYATRGDWVPYFWNSADASRMVVTNEAGALRIQTVSPPSDGRAMTLPPGPQVVVRDFYGWVDILDWDTNAVHAQIGIMARARLGSPFPGDSNGYIGGINVNTDGNLNKARLFVFDGESPDRGGALFPITPGVSYRLWFWGVGNDLSVKLVDLTHGGTLVQERTRTGTILSQGIVALFVQASSRSGFTLDNFFVTATKP
jgi:hypothetical protein